MSKGRKMKREVMKHDRFIICIGLMLIVLEIWKQLTLWIVEFDGRYNVWYFPFQLCSMPMYIIAMYAFLLSRDSFAGFKTEKLRKVLLTFLQDYGFLGGILSLIVHDGLIHPGHILLTAHGFLWHLFLVVLSLYISVKKLSLSGAKGFLCTVPLFLFFSFIAEMINISLHGYGDCDMFYISPFHLSSQPVFHEIDIMVGRCAGIGIYLTTVIIGALMIHKILEKANKLLTI